MPCTWCELVPSSAAPQREATGLWHSSHWTMAQQTPSPLHEDVSRAVHAVITQPEHCIDALSPDWQRAGHLYRTEAKVSAGSILLSDLTDQTFLKMLSCCWMQDAAASANNWQVSSASNLQWAQDFILPQTKPRHWKLLWWASIFLVHLGKVTAASIVLFSSLFLRGYWWLTPKLSSQLVLELKGTSSQ